MNCFLCKGSIKEGITTHVVNLGKCIIVVKNVPCLECSQCGEVWYDNVVVSHLEEIVTACKNVITEITVVNYADQVA